MADALSYGQVKSDRRVQIKMPKMVVDELDKAFPDTDRSKLFTQLALEAIMRKNRFPEPELEELVAEEQHDLDRMWDYLEERDNEL